MTEAYIYNADIYCADCAAHIKSDLLKEFGADIDKAEDSGEYPQGPYSDGGGEADSPQHCGACARFLENPLTEDGYKYVFDLIEDFYNDGLGDSSVLAQWAEFYELTACLALWNLPGCLPGMSPALFVGDKHQAEDDSESCAREFLADSIEEVIHDVPEGDESAKDVEQAAERIRSGESDSEEVDGYIYQLNCNMNLSALIRASDTAEE